MMKGWKEITIGDLGQVITGNTPPRKQPELYGSHTLFVKPTDMEVDRKYCYNPEEYYSDKGFAKYKKSLIPKGSTCVVTIGSIGQKMIKAHSDLFINQAVNAVVPNEEYDQDFVYYLLKINLFQLKTFDSGTASGRENVSKSSFSSIKIKVPNSKGTQRKIASILSAYDDLIENNLKRIKLLEEKAQLTYEEWFAVKGVPTGWTEQSLGKLVGFDIGGGWGQDSEIDGFTKNAFVIRGTDIDKLSIGSSENVPNRWHTESNLKSRMLAHGDIIFEVSGGSSFEGVAKTLLITNELLQHFSSDVMCASFCKLIRPKSLEYSNMMYLFFKYLRKNKLTEIYEKRSASNIVNYNWVAFLEYQKIKVPDTNTLSKFNNEIDPLFKSIFKLGYQNRLLKEARDILLPRLMSGMIDVEDFFTPNKELIVEFQKT